MTRGKCGTAIMLTSKPQEAVLRTEGPAVQLLSGSPIYHPCSSICGLRVYVWHISVHGCVLTGFRFDPVNSWKRRLSVL